MKVNVLPDVIAKKYAEAFVNLNLEDISLDYLNKIIALGDFFKRNRYAYVYLHIPTISNKVKIKALDRIANFFDLQEKMKRLMYVLLDSDRISILDRVIKFIEIVYRKRKGIEVFKAISSHPLTEKEKEKTCLFIKNNVENKVLVKFLVDPKLIVGLRIQSNSFLWERSIEKQLNDIKKFMLSQAGL
ncbi:MAG: ATP synthase F1 subunit delta [bacterium]